MCNKYYPFKKYYKALNFVIHVTIKKYMVTGVTNYQDIVTGLTIFQFISIKSLYMVSLWYYSLFNALHLQSALLFSLKS